MKTRVTKSPCTADCQDHRHRNCEFIVSYFIVYSHIFFILYFLSAPGWDSYLYFPLFETAESRKRKEIVNLNLVLDIVT